MEIRLKSILSKIRDRGEASGLGPDELAYLGELVDGPATDADADAPRPLWWFFRRQALLFRGIFELGHNRWISGIEHILADAGVPQAGRSKPSSHYAQRVTAADLREAVRRNLSSTETDRRAAAALIVGFAELTELAPLLVDALASGREARASYGQPVIAACIESLVRLGHPRAGELALEHLTSQDYNIKQVVVPALLSSADALSDVDLGRLLRSEFNYELIRPFRRAVVRAARAGQIELDTLRRMINDNTWDPGRCLASADILLAGGQRELIVEMLGSNPGNLVAALALRVLEPEGLDPALVELVLEGLRASYDQLYGTTKSAAVLALAAHALEPGPLLLQHLTSGDSDAELGAVWGALARPGLLGASNGAIAAAIAPHAEQSDNPTLRRAAAFVLAHSRGEVDPQLAEIQWQQLLEEDNWWPWQLAVDAARAGRIAAPPLVELFGGIASQPPHGDRDRLERMLAGLAAEPWHLVRWLDRRDTDHEQRQFAVLYAALVGTPLMRSTLEGSLLASTDHWIEESWVLALAALGGPATATASVRGRLLLAEYNQEVKLEPEARQAAVAIALSAKHDLAKTAVLALGSFGGQVEEELVLLLHAEDENVANAAAATAARLREPRIPLVADVSRLLGGQATAARELEVAPQLARLPATAVRQALAELCGRSENALDEVAPLLFMMMSDSNHDVAAAALASWAAHAPDRPWVRDLVVGASRIDEWAAPTAR